MLDAEGAHEFEAVHEEELLCSHRREMEEEGPSKILIRHDGKDVEEGVDIDAHCRKEAARSSNHLLVAREGHAVAAVAADRNANDKEQAEVVRGWSCMDWATSFRSRKGDGMAPRTLNCDGDLSSLPHADVWE